MSFKKLIALVAGMAFLGVAVLATYLIILASHLPKLITVQDYHPLLVSEVYDRDGNKIGEFYREKRMLVDYKQIPQVVVHAFISAEDSSFFEHSGINLKAILRAVIADIRAGRKVQGASTITQQVARSLLLTNKKTYTRKIKEMILAYRMEQHLTKEQILYLYLNQIYLGQGAYGIGAASEIYFRKPVSNLTLAEAALLAGLPQAPTRYSPIYNPSSAKARQKYVLHRMADEGYITSKQAEDAIKEPLQVYVRKDYQEIAPYYLETIRQVLTDKLGESTVLDDGIKIYTGLDITKQLAAEKQVREGLRALDKREGFRGAEQNITEPKKVAEFLLKTRNGLIDDLSPVRVIQPDGKIHDDGPLNLTGKDKDGHPLPNIPSYVKLDQIVKGIVTRVDDKWGLVYVRFAESKGLIDLDTMKWARHPDSTVYYNLNEIDKPSQALKQGDVIEVRVVGKQFHSDRLIDELQKLHKKMRRKYKRPADLPDFNAYAGLELEQEPIAQGALLSLDQKTSDIIAMVGGYDYAKSQFNRTYQAARQTGSSFKSIVYASALDKGFTPATAIIDAPIVYEEKGQKAIKDADEDSDASVAKVWKPTNDTHKFSGDILFRNALIRSMNVPTVKVIEKIGVNWVADYARRLGIFSPLNMDYTLALGTSAITLYEMTKAFSEFDNLGRRVHPMLIHKVEDSTGHVILNDISLDERFESELKPIEDNFERRRLAYLEWKHKQQQQAPNATTPSAGPVIHTPPKTAEVAALPLGHPDQSPQAPAAEAQNLPPLPDPSKEPPIFFDDPDQLISPQTAYVTTSLLKGVIADKHGTGGAARALGRPAAGKTGTTSGYYDAWFIGFTPDITTGVWVGFDKERSLGRGEFGARAALPIWLNYMKDAHENMPVRNFPVPDGIVFANIDNKTGKLASASSKDVVRQAFKEGSAPTEVSGENDSQEDQNFYKEDLSN